MAKTNTKLPLILILALPILLVISTEVARCSFTLFGQTIYVITFVYPLLSLISIAVSKRGESKNAMLLMILSLIMQTLFFVVKWTLLGTIDYVLMEVTFLAFFLSQMIALLGYEGLKELKKTKKEGHVFNVLLIASFIETMFYLCMFKEVTVASLIINFVIKVIYDLVIAKILAK